jgi:hypothetical protein
MSLRLYRIRFDEIISNEFAFKNLIWVPENIRLVSH